MMDKNYIKGRGAQLNTHNRFEKNTTDPFFDDLKDTEEQRALIATNKATAFIEVFPKSILNKMESPDIPDGYGLNPYQGCEHGCVYCYARNSHEYWGYSGGLDFEQKILYKKSAPELLQQKLNSKNYKVDTILLSSNTDCYQPIERKMKITRSILEILLAYKHPVAIITKNTMIERDIDLLTALNKQNLIQINFSLTTIDEATKRKLEPRTASVRNALRTIRSLSNNGIAVNVMMAPIIPGLTHHEILPLAKKVADHGANSIAYSTVRLNGMLGPLMEDWLEKNLPNKKISITNKIKSLHDGSLNDSRFGIRMHGEGKIAEMIHAQFRLAKEMYFKHTKKVVLDFSLFTPQSGKQLDLF